MTRGLYRPATRPRQSRTSSSPTPDFRTPRWPAKVERSRPRDGFESPPSRFRYQAQNLGRSPPRSRSFERGNRAAWPPPPVLRSGTRCRRPCPCIAIELDRNDIEKDRREGRSRVLVFHRNFFLLRVCAGLALPSSSGL